MSIAEHYDWTLSLLIELGKVVCGTILAFVVLTGIAIVKANWPTRDDK